MSEIIPLITNYSPILIGLGWMLLMYHQGHERAIRNALIFVVGVMALAIVGKSIGTVSQNLPMLIAVLILGTVNICLYPRLSDDQQDDFSQGNGFASLGLLAYQLAFQFTDIWFPYLANDNAIMAVVRPVYAIASVLFLLVSIGLFSRSKFGQRVQDQ